MKTTLDLPDDLIREVKLRAVMQRRTVKDLVAEFLRQGLGLRPPLPVQPLPPGSIVGTDEAGLPIIRCAPNAPASRMSMRELMDLEQGIRIEEDLKHAGRPF